MLPSLGRVDKDPVRIAASSQGGPSVPLFFLLSFCLEGVLFLVRLCRVGVLSERTKQIHFSTDPLQDKIHPVQQVKEACCLDARLLPHYRGGSLVLHQQSSACPAHQEQGTTNAQVQSAMCQHSIGLLHSLLHFHLGFNFKCENAIEF